MADYFEEARQTDTTMTVTTADTTPETTALAAPSTEGPMIMAYPPGVSLATITIGAGRTMFGAPPKLISATVTPIFVGTPHVVHTASGWAFYPSPQTFRVENGEELTFELPHVNAEGWRDTAGNEFPALLESGERDRGWAYHAKFTVIGGSGQDAIPHRYEKVFQPLVGQTEPLDLDLVPDGLIGAPVSAPMAVVSSIAGLTGPVSVEQLQAVGLGGLGEDDVEALAAAAADQAVLDAGTYTDHKVDSFRTEIMQAEYLTTVPVSSPAPGEYLIGSTTVQGLTEDKKLPEAAKLDLDSRFPTKMPKALNLRDFGVQGENTVDNAAFLAAITAAKDGRRVSPNGLASDALGTYTIDLPAGDIRITAIQGLMGAEANTTKIRGLRFRGAGSDLTQVIFDPPEAGVLASNQYWQNLSFEGITFSTTKAGSVFMQTVGIAGSAPQDYTFTDVKWNGPWKHGFDLRGTNNNSEYKFFGCATTLMADDGAFLYVGPTDSSDQFLNYWFYGFKHWSTDAPLIDMARGGHVHLFGVDASAWGRNLTTTTKHLINLRGNTHSHGVQTFTARGLRVEAKAGSAALLYCEWADGNVDIQVDWSSQTNTYTYGDIIHMNVGNVAGPVLNVHDSHLCGGVKVTYGVNAWQFQHRLSFKDCVWRQRLTPSEVVSYDESAAGSNKTRPAVRFEGCRGADAQNARVADGASVWDAVISYNRGPLVKRLEKRSLMVQGIYGTITDSATMLRVNLPVGALITGIRAVSPITTSTDADGGSWTVATTEATPTTIATVAVASHMNQGHNVISELTVPFLCDTRARATVTVASTGSTQSRYEAFVVLEGYW